MTTYAEGLVEVQEIVLKKGRLTIPIDVGVTEQIEALDHHLNLVPFCDYKISYDGGETFMSPNFGHTSATERSRVVNAYCDADSFYVAYGTGSGGLPAITLVVDYVLYVTEAV
jgi:hypothetical protein